MNVEKLYTLAHMLTSEEEQGIISSLEAFLASLESTIANPADPEQQQAMSQHLESLRTALEKSEINNFDSDWKDMMTSLNVDNDYGDSLLKKINSVLMENQITPSIAHEKITVFHQIAQINFEHFESITKAFSYLTVVDEKLKQGECEISIKIPREYLDNKMEKLGGELKDISKVLLKPFVEISGETPDGFNIRYISTSDPTVYLAAAPIVAFSIMTAIKLALSVYKEYLEIKLLKKQLEEKKIDKSVIQGYEKNMEKLLNKLITDAVKEYISTMKKKTTKQKKLPGRTDAELRTQITSSLRNMIRKYDAGFSFGVRGECYEPKEEKDEEGNPKPINLSQKERQHNNLIEAIQEANKLLGVRPEKTNQLPELLENTEDSTDED